MTPQELKQWRADHKLSQAQLAKALGVTKRRIEDWEQGLNPIDPLLPSALRGILRYQYVRPAVPGNYFIRLTDGSKLAFVVTVAMNKEGQLLGEHADGNMIPITDAYFKEFEWAGPIPEPIN